MRNLRSLPLSRRSLRDAWRFSLSAGPPGHKDAACEAGQRERKDISKGGNGGTRTASRRSPRDTYPIPRRRSRRTHAASRSESRRGLAECRVESDSPPIDRLSDQRDQHPDLGQAVRISCEGILGADDRVGEPAGSERSPLGLAVESMSTLCQRCTSEDRIDSPGTLSAKNLKMLDLTRTWCASCHRVPYAVS